MKKGDTFQGKFNGPMELFAKWAKEPDVERHVQMAVLDAEEVFLRAYLESQ